MANPSATIQIAQVLPPDHLAALVARQIAALAAAEPDVARLAGELEREPRQVHAAVLVALDVVDGRAVAFLKFARRGPGTLTLVDLICPRPPNSSRPGVALLDHLVSLAQGDRQQVVAEAYERDLVYQQLLRAAGFECQRLHTRSRRQRDRGLWEFRSYLPPWDLTFRGRPRFTWPRGDGDVARSGGGAA